MEKRINVPSFVEIRNRVLQSIAYYDGALPREVVIAWDGYFAALLEFGLISVDQHSSLCDMLPDVSDNPVVQIFLGFAKDDKGML